MALSIITPAATSRLTTVSALRLALGAEGDVLGLDTAEQLIDEASAAISSYLGYPLGQEVVREVIRPNTMDHRLRALMLARWPVSDLTVTADGEELVADTDYEIDLRSGLLYRLSNDNWTPWQARRVVLDYRAGWRLPEEPDRTLPADIEGACIALARATQAARSQNPLLRSQSILNGLIAESFSVGTQSGAVIGDILGRIAQYRTVSV